MLKAKAFANAAAILTGGLYFLAYIAQVGSPEAFKYWFDAQFFGAPMSELLPAASSGEAFGIFITLVVTGWIVGYVFAWLYNRLAR